MSWYPRSFFVCCGGFFTLAVEIEMKALFKNLPVDICTAGSQNQRTTELLGLEGTTEDHCLDIQFRASWNLILTFWLLPLSILPGSSTSQSELCLLPWLVASSSHTALSGATQRSHPRTTSLQLMLWLSAMTYISEYFHNSTKPCVGGVITG